MVLDGLRVFVPARTAREKECLSLVALTTVVVAATVAVPPVAQAQLRESAAKLIAHTMGNPEFRPKSFRGGTWLGNGDAYLDIEPSASGSGSDIVKYQTASGAREIFVAASPLTPQGETN